MNTSSLAFPNMFNVAKNTVNVLEDNESVVNRVKLLILTEPTELYNSPEFGAGLKRYLFQYNTENTRAIMRDSIIQQLNINEPCVKAEQTQFSDDSIFSKDSSQIATFKELNAMSMSIGLSTTFGSDVDVSFEQFVAHLSPR